MRDFRAGARDFFTTGRPGPKTAPGKDAARPRILELRGAGHSIDEIAEALAAEGTPLNRTGIAEVIAAEGLPRLWRRPDAERGGPAREIQARAEALDFTALPARAETRLAGLLLAIPDLIALGVPDMVASAGYPSTPKIPALSYVLSLLALKLPSTRRVSHVYDIAADPGAALLAALTALPKATALTTYSYRLEHAKQAAFLSALDKAVLAAGLADGEALNLDFHAVMHWGEDPVLEKHYVPRRSQRTRSVLTFFAEDAGTHTLLYANADLSPSPEPSRSTSTSTSCCPSWPTPSAPRCAAACPATTPPPPTPSSAASSTPQGSSTTRDRRSSSGSTGGPIHPSSARPACPKRSPSPGGKAGPSATSTPDRTGGRFAE